MPRAALVLVALLLTAAPLAIVRAGHAPCPYEPYHTYASGQSHGTESQTANTGFHGSGFAIVWETNLGDCDGDGVPADYDGSYDFGVGGGFFGYGPWAHETTCNHDLQTFGPTVAVYDLVWGNNIWFVMGADDMNGPTIGIDPVTGATTCSVSGSITPGDPTTDPWADADDCLAGVYVGSGTMCGAGGDGGYWVFLLNTFVFESGGSLTTAPPPTSGTITGGGTPAAASPEAEQARVADAAFLGTGSRSATWFT